MPVVARKEYVGVARDRVENFNGKQLVYASWDHHLLFAAPFLLCLTPQTTFAQLLGNGPCTFAAGRPGCRADRLAACAMAQGQPTLGARPGTPSLVANGIGHKDQLRFKTPGLNTLCATH
jgi:phenol hydroxylase P4 protein